MLLSESFKELGGYYRMPVSKTDLEKWWGRSLCHGWAFKVEMFSLTLSHSSKEAGLLLEDIQWLLLHLMVSWAYELFQCKNPLENSIGAFLYVMIFQCFYVATKVDFEHVLDCSVYFLDNIVCISLIILCDNLQGWGLWVLSQVACFKSVGYIPALIFSSWKWASFEIVGKLIYFTHRQVLIKSPRHGLKAFTNEICYHGRLILNWGNISIHSYVSHYINTWSWHSSRAKKYINFN